MPFNVASIKDKAISAKNATASKIQDTRDKHTSTPMARTRFAESGYLPKAPPPPPPQSSGPGRTSFNSSRGSLEGDGSGDGHGHAPPPIARSTRPGLSSPGVASSSSPPPRGPSVLQRAKMFGMHSSSSSPSPPPPAPNQTPSHRWSARPPPKHHQEVSSSSIDTQVDIDRIDWANLSRGDKQAFFGWLDEFFARYIKKMSSTGLEEYPREEGEVISKNHVEPPRSVPHGTETIAALGPPPPIRSWSKPTTASSPVPPHSYSETPETQPEFDSSYPPATTYGSQGLDLAYYFHPETEWDVPWYASQGAVPPPLQANQHRLYKAQMVSRGDMRSITFAVLFCDLSSAWVSVSFSGSTQQIIERQAQYLDVPASMGRVELEGASEVYGETIASFAESFIGSGQFCARGECWDLAAEALKYITSSFSPSIPTPVPSLGRTHGHLIFVGRATRERFGGIKQEGRWRGGDDRVRRGDIVEWRSVRISRVGDLPGGYATLGDPEHTAIITRDSIPSPPSHHQGVYDGAPLEPRAIASLEVVEQSVNDPPEPVKRTYDLSRFEEGEVWIYRPVSMEVYLGYGELECEVPPHAVSI